MGWLFLGLFNMHPPTPKRGFLICNNWLKAMIYAFLTNFRLHLILFAAPQAILTQKNPIEKPGIFCNACNADPPQSFFITFSPHPPGSKLSECEGAHQPQLCLASQGGTALLVQLATSWVWDMAFTLLLSFSSCPSNKNWGMTAFSKRIRGWSKDTTSSGNLPVQTDR